MKTKKLLLGDEALALGAINAGLSGAYAYPGTPSTEILEFVQGNEVARERRIHSHWSSNEKTAAIHIQLNYKPGKKYKSVVDNLRIRTKKSNQSPTVLPGSGILGILKKGAKIKNLATARVGNQIWMYIGLDKQNQEQWICADTGDKIYVN